MCVCVKEPRRKSQATDGEMKKQGQRFLGSGGDGGRKVTRTEGYQEPGHGGGGGTTTHNRGQTERVETRPEDRR